MLGQPVPVLGSGATGASTCLGEARGEGPSRRSVRWLGVQCRACFSPCGSNRGGGARAGALAKLLRAPPARAQVSVALGPLLGEVARVVAEHSFDFFGDSHGGEDL
eukprot:8818467-Pyramimonas_sp.AAC.1